MKWSKKRVPDNQGRSHELHLFGEYVISLNLNRGDHWAYEVLCTKRYIGEARSLDAAKLLAKRHYVESSDE